MLQIGGAEAKRFLTEPRKPDLLRAVGSQYKESDIMKVIAVDDEQILLMGLTDKLKKAFPEGTDIKSFTDADDALSYVDGALPEKIDYAFLDIQLCGVTGIELAKAIKERMPLIRIIFCTAYSDYALEAFGVHAMGYLMKPVSLEQIRQTVADIDSFFDIVSGKAGIKKTDVEGSEKLRVQTFGNFEAFAHGKKLVWEREKAKELLALLVDRRGAAVSNAEIAIALWEDDQKVSHVNTIVSSLRKTLNEAGMKNVLVKSRNQTAIDVNNVDCDLYSFLDGDVRAVNAYNGEYMSN